MLPCWNWKQNRLDRVAAQMRERYRRRPPRRPNAGKTIQPVKRDAWIKRRKEYLIACGRLDQLRQEFGI